MNDSRHRRAVPTLLLAALLPAAPAPGQATRPATQPSAPETPVGTSPEAAGVGHLVRRIERAHGVGSWQRQRGLRADLQVQFEGKELLRGTMHYDLRGGRARLDLADGTVLVFDGEAAWVSPSSSETTMARFHLLTWPYFLAVPFKLDDPGARVTARPVAALSGRLCETLKLTFAPGTGDTPDDWYLVHVEPGTDRIAAMAYIVTYGTPTFEAERAPRAIVYDGYAEVDDVMLSTDWRFRSWNAEDGVHGAELGRARLRGLRFTDLDEDLFRKPPDARKDELPGR